MAVADLAVGACLAITIGNVARIRFFSPEDIAGSGLAAASGRLAVPTAVLANTTEQALLAALAYAASAVLRDDARPLLQVCAALFVVGRLLFALAYHRGAGARSFGFGLTFYPTLACLGVAASALVG